MMKSSFILCILFITFFHAAIVRAEILKTKYAVISYNRIEDLAKLDSELDVDFIDRSLQRYFSFFGPKIDKKLIPRIKAKIDAIFLKVQRILGMQVRNIKVKIVLYPDSTAFKRIGFRKGKKHVIGLYDPRRNAIYLSLKDVHEGVLAHEMAHAVICNYFPIIPPEQTQEILARYVDVHLHD